MKVETILKNTDAKTLFELFKRYTDKLVENTESLGIFAIDDDFEEDEDDLGTKAVFANSDIRKVVKQLKEKRK